jgi:hypothetical protein
VSAQFIETSFFDQKANYTRKMAVVYLASSKGHTTVIFNVLFVQEKNPFLPSSPAGIMAA